MIIRVLEFCFMLALVVGFITEIALPILTNKPIFGTFKKKSSEDLEVKLKKAEVKIEEVKEVQEEIQENFKKLEKLKKKSEKLNNQKV